MLDLSLANRVFGLRSVTEFNAIALEIFYRQARNNSVYAQYLSHLGVDPAQITAVEDIPYLPIRFFKSHYIVSGDNKPETVFTSSGTTGQIPSRHFVADLAWYERSFLEGFNHVYGDPKQYCFLALLPSYLEREGSSLVYMAEKLMQESGHRQNDFFLHRLPALVQTLDDLERKEQPTILIGVTFALLDLVAKVKLRLNHTVVMETGGMKGRRKEMIREEVHEELQHGLQVQHVHSEYGMTELLSQAYSQGEGIFKCPPWMRVSTRETTDPLSPAATGKSGGLNIIDLANVHSCAFIATEDLGRVYADGSFKALGRFDHSEVRGCNLMAL